MTYFKTCPSCTSDKVAYLYSRNEIQIGKHGSEPFNQYEEFVNYICENCNEKWHVDMAEKDGFKNDEDLNAWESVGCSEAD